MDGPLPLLRHTGTPEGMNNTQGDVLIDRIFTRVHTFVGTSYCYSFPTPASREVKDSRERAQQLFQVIDEPLNLTPDKGKTTWAVGKQLVFFKQECFEKVAESVIALASTK